MQLLSLLPYCVPCQTVQHPQPAQGHTCDWWCGESPATPAARRNGKTSPPGCAGPRPSPCPCSCCRPPAVGARPCPHAECSYGTWRGGTRPAGNHYHQDLYIMMHAIIIHAVFIISHHAQYIIIHTTIITFIPNPVIIIIQPPPQMVGSTKVICRHKNFFLKN